MPYGYAVEGQGLQGLNARRASCLNQEAMPRLKTLCLLDLEQAREVGIHALRPLLAGAGVQEMANRAHQLTQALHLLGLGVLSLESNNFCQALHIYGKCRSSLTISTLGRHMYAASLFALVAKQWRTHTSVSSSVMHPCMIFSVSILCWYKFPMNWMFPRALRRPCNASEAQETLQDVPMDFN